MIQIKCTKEEQQSLLEIFYVARNEGFCPIAEGYATDCKRIKEVSSCDACMSESIKWEITEDAK